ncbi:hypothetical protein MBANPS3_012276 [Mucor bainieri]
MSSSNKNKQQSLLSFGIRRQANIVNVASESSADPSTFNSQVNHESSSNDSNAPVDTLASAMPTPPTSSQRRLLPAPAEDTQSHFIPLDEDEDTVMDDESSDLNANSFTEINPTLIDQEENDLNSMADSAASVRFFKKIVNEIVERGGATVGPKEYKTGDLWARKRPMSAFSLLNQLDASTFYEPDTFLWFPHLLLGFDKSKSLRCPECNHELCVKGFNDESIARRIIDVDRSFYLLTIRYECKNKDITSKTMRHSQHTFQGHHEGIIRQLPLRIQALFPAVLSHKSGFSVDLMEWIRTLMQNSVGPGRMQKILMEKHHLRYDKLQAIYLDAAISYNGSQRPINEAPVDHFQEFSEFNDQMKYAGKIPSAMYIAFMYTTYMDTLVPLMDQEAMKLSCRIMKGDHSHKYNKKLHPISGNSPAFNGLYTICNEFDEIRLMTIVPTTAMEFIEDPLHELLNSLRRNGHQEPELFFTDDVVKDRDFLEKNLPSLKEGVVRVQPKAEDEYYHLEHLESVPSTHTVHVLDTCDRISHKCLDIMSDLEGHDKLYIGFDTEWTAFSNGTYVSPKAAVCQIAYKSSIYILHISKAMRGKHVDSFPPGLKYLLASERIIKVGRSVESVDFKRMREDWKCNPKGSLELHHFCHSKGLLLSPGKSSSLHALTAIVLQKYLPKPENIRTSTNWDVETLSNEAVNYAALDAYVSLEIYQQLKNLPEAKKSLDSSGGVASEAGLSVSIFASRSCSGSPAAFGRLADQSALNDFFLETHKCAAHSNSVHIDRRKCVVVEVTSVKIPSMVLKCHNTRIAPVDTSLVDLDNVQTTQPGLLHVVIEKSHLRTTPSVDVLSRFPLSPVSLADDRIENTAVDVTTAAIASHPSRVLKDVFHLMDMIPVPRFHSCSKEFSRRFRDALFVINKEDKERVSAVLRSEYGKTFEEALRYQPDWVLRRVRRSVPPHEELLPVVEALFEECKTWVDPETDTPLFNTHCLKKCTAVLNSIRNGHVSDPVGINMYQKLKMDQHSLPIYRCMRGTNSVEGGVHQNIIRKFGFFNSSPDLAQCSLAEYRLRHNTDIGSRNRFGVKHRGHYNPWLTQSINAMKASLGHTFKGSYHDPNGNSFSFSPGSETFGICQISKTIANAYHFKSYSPDMPPAKAKKTKGNLSKGKSKKATKDPKKPADPRPIYPTLFRASLFDISMLPVVHAKKIYDSSYALLAKLQNTRHAVVPVHTKEERDLFQLLLDSDCRHKDGKEPNWLHQCYNWSYRCNTQTANGNLFYKTPYHLKTYYATSIAYKLEKVSIEDVNHESVERVTALTASENRPAVVEIPASECVSFSATALGPFPDVQASSAASAAASSTSTASNITSRKRNRVESFVPLRSSSDMPRLIVPEPAHVGIDPKIIAMFHAHAAANGILPEIFGRPFPTVETPTTQVSGSETAPTLAVSAIVPPAPVTSALVPASTTAFVSSLVPPLTTTSILPMTPLGGNVSIDGSAPKKAKKKSRKCGHCHSEQCNGRAKVTYCPKHPNYKTK